VSRPLLLDLFCGAGGAAMGYHRAGFDVVGVDIKPQPHYPFEFHEDDALDFLTSNGWKDWAVIHASPPCQRYIRGGLQNRAKHPDLLPPTRTMLNRAGLPYVIENVPGAPMRPDVVLCGSAFGLKVRRHRWFESNAPMPVLVPACDHSRPITGVYGHPHGTAGAWPGMLPSTAKMWAEAMGIDWMTPAEMGDAIPPAYTEFIGAQLIEHLERVA
jgi:DNA (cytosine-5)-methyltransferase 1